MRRTGGSRFELPREWAEKVKSLTVWDLRRGRFGKVEMGNESETVSELVKKYGIDYSKKNNQYEVPLLLNGKVITKVKVWKESPNSPYAGQWRLVGWNGGVALEQEWQKVIRKWPKNNGYNPVLISIYGKRSFYGFMHIPEKNDYNLTLMRNLKIPYDSIALTSDSTYSTLSDSRKVIKYFKTQ